jgi:hypothetical protein
MKKFALLLTSILTAVLLLSQTALAGWESTPQAGDYPSNDIKPEIESGLASDPNCRTCIAHMKGGRIGDETNVSPFAKAGTGSLDNSTTKSGTGNR